MDIKIIGVIFGCAILTAIIIKYLRKDSEQPILLTCFLSFIGFALVASPAWTNISFKSGEIELQLINETTQQMDSYVKIIDSYDARSRSWKNPNGSKLKTDHLGILELARELESQKEKIEQAKHQGNIEQAIIETQKGTEVIAKIAMRINNA